MGGQHLLAKMRRVLRKILAYYVFLASLAGAGFAVVALGHAEVVVDISVVVQLGLAMLGLGSIYFLFQRTSLLRWLHIAWWFPQLYQIGVVR